MAKEREEKHTRKRENWRRSNLIFMIPFFQCFAVGKAKKTVRGSEAGGGYGAKQLEGILSIVYIE